MFLQVWKKAHPGDTALLHLYSLPRKKKKRKEKRNHVIVKNEDVTYSSELGFLLFCGSLKAICSPKPGSIFPAQVIS